MEETVSVDKRLCSICGHQTYKKQWYSHKCNWYCKKCENKLFINPKWHPITNPKIHEKWHPVYNPKDILYKGKSIHLKENPRKGICSLCKKSKGDEYINCFGQVAIIKKTAMHHTEYHDDDPLKDTIELCVSCHMKLEKTRMRSIGRIQ